MHKRRDLNFPAKFIGEAKFLFRLRGVNFSATIGVETVDVQLTRHRFPRQIYRGNKIGVQGHFTSSHFVSIFLPNMAGPLS